MNKTKFVLPRVLFLLLCGVWFFLSFEIDNNAGDMHDTPFRALFNKYDSASQVGVDKNAYYFVWIFLFVMVLLAGIFTVRFFFHKKPVCLAAAAGEYACVIFMLCRFSITADGWGNITYIPAVAMLIYIACNDFFVLRHIKN